MKAKIVVTTSASDGPPISEHALDESLTIGRVAGNDIVLPDVEKRVSSRHARIERVPGGWQLVDLGSTNGTFLNERRLEPKAAVPLRHDDRIAVGVFHLRFLDVDMAEGTDRTIAAVDVPRTAAKLAEELPLAYARHADAAPEARRRALRDLLREATASMAPESARSVIRAVQSRFRAGEPAGPERPTAARRQDQEIQRREELYQAGSRLLAELSRRFVGDDAFETVDQVERFGRLMAQALELTFDWIGKSLGGRKEFEEQFSADLTMVFGKQRNPLKAASTGKDMALYLLDWRGDRSPAAVRASLDEAFKDLTMHQIGLLAGVQEALSAVLRRLDPKSVEAEVKSGGLFSSLPKRAWERYAEIYEEIFAENSRLFNEMIYPNVRKGYLGTHSQPPAVAAGGSASPAPKPEEPRP